MRRTFYFFADCSRLSQRNRMRNLAKRIFDLFLITTGLIIFSPLLAVAALVIQLAKDRPALYPQKRTEVSDTFLIMRKFSTLTVVTRTTSHLSDDDGLRVTQVGHWIEKFKFEDLTQLWEIGKSKISFTGPHTESPDYTKLYKQRP